MFGDTVLAGIWPFAGAEKNRGKKGAFAAGSGAALSETAPDRLVVRSLEPGESSWRQSGLLEYSAGRP